MDNFDLRKFITEGKLYEEKDVIEPEEEEIEVEDLGDGFEYPEEKRSKNIDYIKTRLLNSLKKTKDDPNYYFKDIKRNNFSRVVKLLLSDKDELQYIVDKAEEVLAYDDFIREIIMMYSKMFLLGKEFTSEDYESLASEMTKITGSYSDFESDFEEATYNG